MCLSLTGYFHIVLLKGDGVVSLPENPDFYYAACLGVEGE